MSTTTELDYVARSPCGCITAWQSAGSNPEHIAEALAEWITSGRSVERMTTEQSRKEFGCVHQNPRLKASKGGDVE